MGLIVQSQLSMRTALANHGWRVYRDLQHNEVVELVGGIETTPPAIPSCTAIFFSSPEVITHCMRRRHLLDVIEYEDKFRQLQLELAVVIDAGKAFVTWTYLLEGGGELATLASDLRQEVAAACAMED